MKAFILLPLLFHALFGVPVTVVEKPHQVQSKAEFQKIVNSTFDKDVIISSIDMSRVPEVIKSEKDLKCPSPNIQDETYTYLSTVSDISLYGDSVSLSCIVTQALTVNPRNSPSQAVGYFEIKRKIDLPSFGVDAATTAQNYNLIVSELQQNDSAFSPEPFQLSNHTLSQVLTALFTLDADMVDTMLTSQHQRVIFQGDFQNNNPSFDFLLKTKLPTLFYFIKKSETEIYIFVYFLFGVFVLYTVVSISKLLLDKENRSQLKPKIYLVTFVVLFFTFVPYPGTNGFLTTNAAKTIQYLTQTVNGVADDMAARVLESAINNAYSTGGIKNINQIRENLNAYANVSAQKNLASRYLNSSACEYVTLDSTEAIEFKNNFYKGCASGECPVDIWLVKENNCRGLYNSLAYIDKEQHELFRSLSNYSNTNVTNTRLAEAMYQSFTQEYSEDGWISLMYILPKLDMLAKKLHGENEDLLDKTEKEIDKLSSKGNTINYIFQNVPYLMVPGASTVLQANQNAFSSIPFIGGLIGTSTGLASAITYSHLFLEQLPRYIFIFLIAIFVMLFFFTLLMFTLVSYFILPAAVLYNNIETVKKFASSFLVILLQSIKLVMVSLVTYSTAGFASDYLRAKTLRLHADVDNFNHIALSSSSIDGRLIGGWFNTAEISLFDGVLTVGSVFLSAFLSYWLITKISKMIMEWLGSAGSSIFNESVTELNNKLQQKR